MIRAGKALVLACMAGLCGGWTPVDLHLSDHYNVTMMGISRSKDSVAEKVAKLEREYDRIFVVHDNSNSLRELVDDDLLAMFRSANMMASYTMYFHTEENPRFLAAMETALSEIERRGAVPSGVTADMVGAYIAARRFEDANRVIAASGDGSIEALPDKVSRENFVEDRPGAFSFDAASGRIDVSNFEMEVGDVIVIVAGCHVSRDAAEDIARTPSLKQAFGQARTLWLSPADRQFDPSQIRAWNKEFPDQPMLIAYSHAPWKGVDFSQIPNFYFYRDGKLIAQHAGWKKGGAPQPVLDALRRMELLK